LLYLVKDNKKDILKILIEKGYNPKICN
jgi:hypothetical protein